MRLPRRAPGTASLRSAPEIQAQSAEELGLLPDGSATAEMLSDFAVLRDQVRARPD
ncbi:hypothetical protein [Halovulum marinum]|uniref:hypothetical protein n=1 Tax=Halovulum marinum TaxID=2662447 RepID=UPI001F408D95|nr:hypothetical protein [Halovulum marinum]